MTLGIEHEALTDLLVATRQQSVKALTSIDLAAATATAPQGYVVLAQLEHWDRWACALLRAHAAEAVADTAALPAVHIAAQRQPISFENWQTTRQTLVATINELTFKALHTAVPLGAGAIYVSELVKRVIGHEQWHIQLICGHQPTTHFIF